MKFIYIRQKTINSRKMYMKVIDYLMGKSHRRIGSFEKHD